MSRTLPGGVAYAPQLRAACSTMASWDSTMRRLSTRWETVVFGVAPGPKRPMWKWTLGPGPYLWRMSAVLRL